MPKSTFWQLSRILSHIGSQFSEIMSLIGLFGLCRSPIFDKIFQDFLYISFVFRLFIRAKWQNTVQMRHIGKTKSTLNIGLVTDYLCPCFLVGFSHNNIPSYGYKNQFPGMSGVSILTQLNLQKVNSLYSDIS